MKLVYCVDEGVLKDLPVYHQVCVSLFEHEFPLEFTNIAETPLKQYGASTCTAFLIGLRCAPRWERAKHIFGQREGTRIMEDDEPFEEHHDT